MSLQLLALLRRIAIGSPHAVALIEESGRNVTYSQLVQRVDSICHALRMEGLTPGDRVLFAIRPSATAIASIIALIELGAVVVAAQPGVGDELFRAQMELVQTRWIVAESMLLVAMQNRLVRRFAQARGSTLPSASSLNGARMIATGPWLPGLGRATPLEALERRARNDRSVPSAGGVADELAGEDPARFQSHNDAFIVFTSGTTAAPKAVVHSRGSLAATLEIVSAHLSINAGDRLHTRDLHLIIPALLAGATIFVPRGPQFDAQRTAQLLHTQRITHLYDVTANLQQIVEQMELTGSRFPESLTHVLAGSAPVRQAFFRRLQSLLPPAATAWCVYGMTEMLPVAAITLEEKLAYTGDGDIVGAPVAGVSVGLKHDGELTVTGPNLFTRYLGGDPVRSHDTGDLARMEQGRIVLIGRAKDMIIRGEYNVYPELHEPIIERIPGVRRCALIGVFDELHADEQIVLFVQPLNAMRSSSDRALFAAKIDSALRSGPHRIDDAALPDRIIVADLPLTGRSSKVDKASLRLLATSEPLVAR